jgi:uncharacterized membrane protein
MNANNLRSTISSGMAAVAAVGMLAALSAQAGSGLIKVTHAATPYRSAKQEASVAAANTQQKANPAKPAEVQVAVMADAPAQPALPAQPAAKRGAFIHR